LELMLSKVEAIGVDQPLAGRLLGYGTLRIVGTGGTVEEFERVARPDGLREAVVRQAPPSPAARARWVPRTRTVTSGRGAGCRGCRLPSVAGTECGTCAGAPPRSR